MKNLIKALIPGVIACSIAGVATWANYNATAGSGLVFFSYDNLTPKIPGMAIIDSSGSSVLGTSQDVAYTSGNGTVISLLKGIFTQVSSAIVAGTARIGYTTDDPCTSTATKINLNISQITSTKIISGTSAKKTYICSMFLIAPDAEVIALVEGTGSTCATSTANIIGTSPAASGVSLAANGGFTLGNGQGWVAAATAANANDVCLLQSSTGRLGGNVTYVQQ